MGEGAGKRGGGFAGAKAALVALVTITALALPVRGAAQSDGQSDGQSGDRSDGLPGTSHLNWDGRLERRTLGDSSVLNEYTALTAAIDTDDVAFRVGFLPRFDCSPVIGVRFGGDMASVPEAFFDDGDTLAVTIDGEALEWPLLIDGGGTATTLWFDGELSRRADIRRRLDVGSRAALTLPNAISVSFSLLGSRRSTAEVESACLTHEPLPWGD